MPAKKKDRDEIFPSKILCISMKRKKTKARSFRCAAFLMAILGLLLLGGSDLYAGWIKIVYPNGGEVLKAGTRIQIKWQSEGLQSKVVIVLYKKGIKHLVISPQTDNNGTFSWRIPANIPEGNEYRVRIRSFEELSVNDFSDRDFTIKK
jgi:hypothetical protein